MKDSARKTRSTRIIVEPSRLVRPKLRRGLLGTSLLLPLRVPLLLLPLGLAALLLTLKLGVFAVGVTGVLSAVAEASIWLAVLLVVCALEAVGIQVVADADTGEEVSLSSMRKEFLLSVRRLPTILAVLLLLTCLLLALHKVPLAIVGLSRIIPGLILAVLAILIVVPYVGIRLFGVVQAAILDGEDLWGSIRRTLSATKGEFWSLFILFILVGVAVGLISLVILPIGILLPPYLAVLLLLGIATMSSGVYASCSTLAYLDLTAVGSRAEPKKALPLVPWPTREAMFCAKMAPPVPKTGRPQFGPRRLPECTSRVDCMACVSYTLKGGKDYCIKYHKFLR